MLALHVNSAKSQRKLDRILQNRTFFRQNKGRYGGKYARGSFSNKTAVNLFDKNLSYAFKC